VSSGGYDRMLGLVWENPHTGQSSPRVGSKDQSRFVWELLR